MVVMGRTVAGQQRGPRIELYQALFLAIRIHFHINLSEKKGRGKGLRREMKRYAKSRETWMGLDVLALS